MESELTVAGFSGLVSWLGDQLSYILSFVISLLPDSPFKLLDYTPIKQYLPYINYFVPIDYILSLLSVWCIAISVYYCYHVAFRWTKAIQ